MSKHWQEFSKQLRYILNRFSNGESFGFKLGRLQQTANQFSQSLELLEKIADENEVLAILRQFPMSEVVN